ncbi:alpha/beta hydrolase [Streptomyces durocortorensis]|uniref:alpha/beta hydrolase n=1 Tax=Streptomyces durocortorensis TaxID=2811104 RepID=UPI0027DDDDDC|nr:alpha/beta hydrolase [Streptomyces durocortorensis]
MRVLLVEDDANLRFGVAAALRAAGLAVDETFVLPVARAATGKPDRRIGSLVYNPGGPGAPGVQSLEEGMDEAFGRAARDRFDIVAVDPRGVGASVPALTCTADEDEDEAGAGEDASEPPAPEGVAPLHPRTEKERTAAAEGARAATEDCERHSGDLLRHVGTQDAARDLNVPHPRGLDAYWDALPRAEEAAGVYGTAAVTAELTCRGWPSGEGKPHRVEADGVAPVLVVGTTGDASTPYEEAVSLAEQFPGGMLLTYEGMGHTAYGRGDACVTEQVDAYLVDLEPVRPDATC